MKRILIAASVVLFVLFGAQEPAFPQADFTQATFTQTAMTQVAETQTVDHQLADLDVVVEPGRSAVVLGEDLDLSVSVTNRGSEPARSLVVHLDITDPARSSSVDPEDWTPTLSHPVSSIGPGESVVLNWRLQPISPGTFAVYVVVLSPGAADLASSNVATVAVDDQRSLNPNGILPVALGAPVLVGGLLLGQISYRRRSRVDSV